MAFVLIAFAAAAPLALAAAPAVAAAPAAPAAGPKCDGTTVVGVAHQDDDLLFINPAIENDFKAGRCIRVIYLTAGDAGEVSSTRYYLRRELGVQQAYAALARVPMSASRPTPWKGSDLTVAGRRLHSVTLFTGAGKPDVQLVFLRLPDGEPDGSGTPTFGNQSLLKLWQGTISSMRPVDGSASYTSAALTSTLTDLIVRFHGTTVRTLDYMNTELGYSDDLDEGLDHADHAVTARYMRLAFLAAKQRLPRLTLVSYEGYGISILKPDLSASVTDRKAFIFKSYDVHDDKPGTACPGIYCPPDKPLAAAYKSWLPRWYVRPLPAPKAGEIASWIGDTFESYTDADLCLTQEGGRAIDTAHCAGLDQKWRLDHGLLHAGTASGQCVDVTGTSVSLGACGSKATRWQVTKRGQLRTGSGCLTQDDMLSLKPRLHLLGCTPLNPGQRWFLGQGVV